MMRSAGTVTIPWCASCERSRFERECFECGEALEFYADSDQWHWRMTELDRGKRARDALYPDQEGV